MSDSLPNASDQLLAAIEADDAGAVRRAVAAGADVNHRDALGHSLLAKTRHPALAGPREALLAAGARESEADRDLPEDASPWPRRAAGTVDS